MIIRLVIIDYTINVINDYKIIDVWYDYGDAKQLHGDY